MYCNGISFNQMLLSLVDNIIYERIESERNNDVILPKPGSLNRFSLEFMSNKSLVVNHSLFVF